MRFTWRGGRLPQCLQPCSYSSSAEGREASGKGRVCCLSPTSVQVLVLSSLSPPPPVRDWIIQLTWRSVSVQVTCPVWGGKGEGGGHVTPPPGGDIPERVAVWAQEDPQGSVSVFPGSSAPSCTPNTQHTTCGSIHPLWQGPWLILLAPSPHLLGLGAWG